MKKIKSLLILGFIVFGSISAQAQYSLGLQYSFLSPFKNPITPTAGLDSLRIANHGIGIKLDLATSDMMGIYLGFNYYTPSKYDSLTLGHGNKENVNPSQIVVNLQNKISYSHLNFGVKRYIVGDFEADAGFYGTLGLGLMVAQSNLVINKVGNESYIESKYDLDYDVSKAKNSYMTVPLEIGIGGEVNLGFGYLFFDGKYNLPLSKSHEAVAVKDLEPGEVQEIGITIPMSYSLNFGIRIPLGNY